MIRKEPLDGGLFIRRDTEKPGYTTDSLLLIRFARLKRADRVIDLGSGTGILSIYGEKLYGSAFTGVEIDPEQAALAGRSAAENGQEIVFHTMDVREAPAFFGDGSFSAAVCNPPYFGPSSPNLSRAFTTARHADREGLDAFVSAAFRLLKNRGRFFLCCPAGAVSRVCACLEMNRLIPKRMRRVCAAEGRPPYLILTEAVKLGGDGVVWEEDIILKPEGRAAGPLERSSGNAIMQREAHSAPDPRGEDGTKA